MSSPYLQQIQWFWRALRSFDQADRAKFLQFVTGTSKVPLQGFAALEGMNGPQKFQIHRDDRSTERLPSAHTWYVLHWITETGHFFDSFFRTIARLLLYLTTGPLFIVIDSCTCNFMFFLSKENSYLRIPV